MIEIDETQVIKTLECCINDDCDNCPDSFGNCEHNAMRNALKIINLKNEKIKELQELIKNFPKILKEAFPESNRDNISPAIYYDDYCEIIDEIAEELIKE